MVYGKIETSRLRISDKKHGGNAPMIGLHTPHLDILRPDGKKDRTIDLSILENSQAMNVAIEDFTNNWSQYLERWKKWKK